MRLKCVYIIIIIIILIYESKINLLYYKELRKEEKLIQTSYLIQS